MSTFQFSMEKPNSSKRQRIDLATKKVVIEASARKSYNELAKEFGIPKTSVRNILQNKSAVLSAIDGGSEGKRARLTTGKHEKMEAALVQWHKQVRSQNVSVSGNLLKVRTFIYLSVSSY